MAERHTREIREQLGNQEFYYGWTTVARNALVNLVEAENMLNGPK